MLTIIHKRLKMSIEDELNITVTEGNAHVTFGAGTPSSGQNRHCGQLKAYICNSQTAGNRGYILIQHVSLHQFVVTTVIMTTSPLVLEHPVGAELS